MEDVLQGNDLWSELNGKKDELTEEVEIEFGGVKGKVTVVFKEASEISDIYTEYDAKLPKKPTLKVSGMDAPIEIPSDEYPQFNDHPNAKPKIEEWKKKCKPVENERLYRMAYEYIAEDERPGDDIEEGVKILKGAIRETDAMQICKVGAELAGFSNQLDDARKNS